MTDKIKCPLCDDSYGLQELADHLYIQHMTTRDKYLAKLLFKIHEKIVGYRPDNTVATWTNDDIIQELKSLLESAK